MADVSTRSEQEIQEAGVSEVLAMVQSLGYVNDNKLEDISHMRERIILAMRKMNGRAHKWKPMFSSVASNCKDKTVPLELVMREVLQTFTLMPRDSYSTDPLTKILWQERFLSPDTDLVTEVTRRIDRLVTNDSLIVVAGETNGGKSSLLNLLLGVDILPTDFVHCTFAICKIKYSHFYSIETLSFDGMLTNYHCDGLEEARNILKAKVTEEDMKKRGRGPSLMEITLCLPAEILKSGITLVDTPGIGEAEELDNVTLNYVMTTNIAGFVYVIKTDNAGGVQEDRLIQFLSAVRSSYSSESSKEYFDPQSAMFVCHRWDNIREEVRDKVKQNAIDKLEYAWPGFEPSQLYMFSTIDVQRHLPVDPAFVPDSLFQLLTGLQDLFCRAINGSIKEQFVWARNIVHPASRHLKAMILHCTRTNDELESYFKQIKDKQEVLSETSRENAQNIKRTLTERLESVRKMIHMFLGIRFDRLTSDEVPPDLQLQSILEMCSDENFFVKRENRRRLDEEIYRNLFKCLDGLVRTRGLISTMEIEVLDQIETHLGLFKSQIRDIKRALVEGKMTRINSSPNVPLGSSSASGSSSTNSSILAEEDDDDVIGTSMDPEQIAMSIKNLLEKNRSTRPITFDRQKVRQTALGQFKDKLVHHNNDPEMYIKKRYRVIAERIRADEESMRQIIDGYAEWITNCVDRAVLSIPLFIGVNMNIMEQIREHRLLFQRDKDLLKTIMAKLEPIRNHLRGYGLLYMKDVSSDSLCFSVDRRTSSVTLPESIGMTCPNNDSGFIGSGSTQNRVRDSCKECGISFWARLQSARMVVDDLMECVVVKAYSREMEETSMLSEIAALRCLDHPNIAEFFGMTRLKLAYNSPIDDTEEDSEVPRISSFIFRADLTSARSYMVRHPKIVKQWTHNMIMSLLEGLQYLHKERLVHMELNLDTVMIDRKSGDVKLCHVCTPKAAVFPDNRDLPTGPCVCLSPAVLDGDVYEPTDDIYAFGLLLWECAFPDCDRPFQEEREWPLKKFITECHPKKMLAPALEALPASHDTMSALKVLKGTLLVTRFSSFMTVAEIKSNLETPIPPPRRKRHGRDSVSDAPASVTTSCSAHTKEAPRNLRRKSVPAMVLTDTVRRLSASSRSYVDHQSSSNNNSGSSPVQESPSNARTHLRRCSVPAIQVSAPDQTEMSASKPNKKTGNLFSNFRNLFQKNKNSGQRQTGQPRRRSGVVICPPTELLSTEPLGGQYGEVHRDRTLTPDSTGSVELQGQVINDDGANENNSSLRQMNGSGNSRCDLGIDVASCNEIVTMRRESSGSFGSDMSIDTNRQKKAFRPDKVKTLFKYPFRPHNLLPYSDDNKVRSMPSLSVISNQSPPAMRQKTHGGSKGNISLGEEDSGGSFGSNFSLQKSNATRRLNTLSPTFGLPDDVTKERKNTKRPSSGKKVLFANSLRTEYEFSYFDEDPRRKRSVSGPPDVESLIIPGTISQKDEDRQNSCLAGREGSPSPQENDNNLCGRHVSRLESFEKLDCDQQKAPSINWANDDLPVATGEGPVKKQSCKPSISESSRSTASFALSKSKLSQSKYRKSEDESDFTAFKTTPELSTDMGSEKVLDSSQRSSGGDNAFSGPVVDSNGELDTFSLNSVRQTLSSSRSGTTWCVKMPDVPQQEDVGNEHSSCGLPADPPKRDVPPPPPTLDLSDLDLSESDSDNLY